MQPSREKEATINRISGSMSNSQSGNIKGDLVMGFEQG